MATDSRIVAGIKHLSNFPTAVRSSKAKEKTEGRTMAGKNLTTKTARELLAKRRAKEKRNTRSRN
jgi:hypothetical protein